MGASKYHSVKLLQINFTYYELQSTEIDSYHNLSLVYSWDILYVNVRYLRGKPRVTLGYPSSIIMDLEAANSNYLNYLNYMMLSR